MGINYSTWLESFAHLQRPSGYKIWRNEIAGQYARLLNSVFSQFYTENNYLPVAGMFQSIAFVL